MDPSVQQDLDDERPRRRRRRRRSSQEESESSPVAARDILSIARQLAGLAVFGLFFLFVVVAPIPMGGNRDWAWAPMVVVVGLLGMLCALGVGGREGFKLSDREITPLLTLGAFFVAFVAIVALQMSPFAPSSPIAAIYAEAGRLLNQTIVPVGSLAADTARDALLRCLACALLFVIGRVLFHDQQWSKLLLMVFLVSAVIVVTYGIVMTVTKGSCYVGSFLKKDGVYFATDKCLMSGTFVGSNNFGCFCGMAVLAAVGLMFTPSRSRRNRRSDDEFDDESNPLMEWVTGRRVALMGLAVYFAGGLLLSASRASVISTLIALMIFGYLLRRGLPRVSMARVALIGGVVGIALLVLAGGVFLAKASQLFNIGTLNRVVIWQTSLQAFLQAPWFGWGLGSYNDIYAINQPISIVLPNDKAHSTPLEFLVEVGILGAIPAFAACLIPWGVCLFGGLRKRGERELPAIAFAVAAVAILHSMIDFSLQMPAIAFVVSAILGLGWAQTFKEADPPRRSFASDEEREYIHR